MGSEAIIYIDIFGQRINVDAIIFHQFVGIDADGGDSKFRFHREFDFASDRFYDRSDLPRLK